MFTQSAFYFYGRRLFWQVFFAWPLQRSQSTSVQRKRLPMMGDAAPIELYRKREKIYPRAVSGVYARFRVAGVIVLLGVFYGVPWLQWPLFGDISRQAVLFDLPDRKFYLFDYIFWPQDFLFLSGLLILCALSLFFFTALAGRLWCGYACPQTVWTELFLWIEAKVEGSRNQQIKLDKATMGSAKFVKKFTKHTIWVVLSIFTGFTFVGYFTPMSVLFSEAMHLSLGPWELFWILFYGFATYGNAGWMREQVCLYMCPYARFQSAMFDDDTLIISYDESRGEPRGARKRASDATTKQQGHCVDCTLCVQVCPTGIDIRNGLQYECIGCAACVDVCDSVMDKMNYPAGLISYTTENMSKGKPRRILRPRICVYLALLAALLTALGIGLATRLPLELDIIRDRNALFRETSDGLVENIYTLRVLNMDKRAHDYILRVEGVPGIVIGGSGQSANLHVPAGEVLSQAVSLQADPYVLDKPNYEIFFSIQALDDPALLRREPARFIGPAEE